MASEPIIVTAADLHVDAESVGGWSAEHNMHSNWVESFRQVNAIVDLCNEVGADYLVVAGDTFHTGRPKAHAVSLLMQALSRLERTKVIFLDGNHDQQSVVGSHRTPIAAYLSEHPRVIHTASASHVFEDDGVQFALAPWTRVAGQAKLGETNLSLSDTITHLGDKIGNGPSMFASHIVVDEATFDSGRRSSETSMTTSTLEASVPTELIDAGPWALARLGHIHKRQQITDKTGYVGSPYKVSFGEHKDLKGVDIIRFGKRGGAKLEFHPLDVRELIKADLTEGSGESAKVVSEEAKPGDVVRFIIDHEGEPKGFQKALKTLGSKGITPQIVRQPKGRLEGGRRTTGIALDIDARGGFRAYAEQQNITGNERTRLEEFFLGAISDEPLATIGASEDDE